jgi:HlyD family secretion protein
MKLKFETLELIKKFKLPILAFCGFLFAIFLVFNKSNKDETKIAVDPPSSNFTSNIAGIGVVEPRSEVINLGTDIQGVAREIYVQVGQHVKKNDPLISLDIRDIDAQIKVMQAKLEVAKIQAKNLSAQFEISKKLNEKKLISIDDFNKSKYAMEASLMEVESTKAQLEQLNTTKDRLVIKAPIDGKILFLNVRKGELVSFTSNPIVMGDTEVLHVRAEIDEYHTSSLRKNYKQAIGYCRGDTTHPINLEFVRFEPYIKPKQNLAVSGQRVDTRVIQVIYSIPQNQNDKIFVGQQIDVFVKN